MFRQGLVVDLCHKVARPVTAHALLRGYLAPQPWMAARARWSSAAPTTNPLFTRTSALVVPKYK
eukprot:356076-Prymnesium_polylepis.1